MKAISTSLLLAMTSAWDHAEDETSRFGKSNMKQYMREMFKTQWSNADVNKEIC